MPEEVDASTLEFVRRVARTRRTYAEAMSAWRSSCPRLAVWEDALTVGLVHVNGQSGGPIDAAPVLLTPRGETVLGRVR
jgi:hypothetical protein